MGKFELKLPKMGESVAEATLTNWLKEVGDTIEEDEAVLEIATDKVDSEVPSEVEGVLLEKLFEVDDIIQVGETIAIIEIAGMGQVEDTPAPDAIETIVPAPEIIEKVAAPIETTKEVTPVAIQNTDKRFYSPLVRNIAKAEGISQPELDVIIGTGKDDRVTKNDILIYVENRSAQPLIEDRKSVV